MIPPSPVRRVTLADNGPVHAVADGKTTCGFALAFALNARALPSNRPVTCRGCRRAAARATGRTAVA